MDEPARGYQRREVVGCRVFINDAALAHADDVEGALRILERQLNEIKRAVPSRIFDVFKSAAIWIEWESQLEPANFHPSRKWLAEHAYDPAKANTIEISRARDFVAAVGRNEPMLAVLHELAHYYHHNVLGDENVEIKSAFDKAVAAHRYQRVCGGLAGRWFEQSNAFVDPHEYFAKLTEAWFGCADYYPFTREQLREFDPDGFALVDHVWAESQPLASACPMRMCPKD